MSIPHLFSRLKELGIRICLDDDNLKINASGGTLTPDLLEQIRDRKKEVIEFLQKHVQEKEEFVSIEAVEEKEYYVLSPAQKRLFFLQQLRLDDVSYNLTQAVILEGDPERDTMKETFRKLLERHESLRTSFVVIGSEPVQIIRKPGEIRFEIESYEPAVKETDAALPLLQAVGFVRPFDLSDAPLLRVGLVEPEDKKYLLMLDMHHIIADGISLAILEREFMQLYGGQEFPALRKHYKDFAEWQNRQKAKESVKKQEQYWLNQFAGDLPVLNLPTDYPRPDVRSFAGRSVLFRIEKSQTAKIRALLKETDTTLYIFLLSIYTILLSQYADQDDIVVGSGIAGRTHGDVGSIIGMFVNMLPMLNHPVESKTFYEFLIEVKENALKAYANQNYPFDELVNKLGLQGELQRNPLFDVEFTLQNIGLPVVEIPGLTLKPYEYDQGRAKFDLVLHAFEEEDYIRMILGYSTELFKKSTAEDMGKHFLEILDQILGDGEMRLKDIKVSHELSHARSTVDKDRIPFDF